MPNPSGRFEDWSWPVSRERVNGVKVIPTHGGSSNVCPVILASGSFPSSGSAFASWPTSSLVGDSRPRRRRHALGAKGYEGIAQFGRDHGVRLAHLLGFRRKKTPTKSTFSVIFRVLDVVAFEQALSGWITARLPQDQQLAFALDGKTARGSRDGEVPGQHLVAAYCTQAHAVLAQVRVDAKTNEHKAALEMLGILPVKGNIITGDAMFCQRDLCAAIIAEGGDYLFAAKDNQPSLVVDIKAGLAYQEQARRSAAAFSP
jgi:hypothetical protein